MSDNCMWQLSLGLKLGNKKMLPKRNKKMLPKQDGFS